MSGLAVNFQVHVSCILLCSVHLGVELLGHILGLCSILVDNAKVFQSGYISFYF